MDLNRIKRFSKAIAGAASAIATVAAGQAVGVVDPTGIGVPIEVLAVLPDAWRVVAVYVVAGVIGFVTVYQAPANVPPGT